MSEDRIGICSECQSEHPVHRSADIPREEMDPIFGPYGAGENDHYLMVEHDFYGRLCDGSGTIPQFLDKNPLK